MSMLARRRITILPAMPLADAIETTCIHRVASLTSARTTLVAARPYRAAYHMISDVGLIGRGHVPMPGDMSRAPHGFSRLNALPEFPRPVLEGLRPP
jgi:magnesium chelatase family protein